MGAAALSFVQVAVDRAGSGPAGLLERSRCPRCEAQLRALDVLPIAGFVLLHGRCRGCRAPIPRRHLVGELVAALLWAAAVRLLGATVWLPLVLVAPLAALLLHSPMVRAGSARDLVLQAQKFQQGQAAKASEAQRRAAVDAANRQAMQGRQR